MNGKNEQRKLGVEIKRRGVKREDRGETGGKEWRGGERDDEEPMEVTREKKKREWKGGGGGGGRSRSSGEVRQGDGR